MHDLNNNVCLTTERAKSPPLVKQDELDELSTEGSSEGADVSVLEDFSATGDFRPGKYRCMISHNGDSLVF